MTAERLTIQKVKTELDTHLHDHDIKLDPKLHDVYHAVFGEQGKGGLQNDVERLKMMDERLKKIESDINKVLWAIVMAVLAAILKLVIIG